MKIKSTFRTLAMSTAILGLAVGCASAPKEEPAPEPEVTPVSSGPTDAVLSRAFSRAASKIDRARSLGAPGWQEAEGLLEAGKGQIASDKSAAYKSALAAGRSADTAVNQYYLDGSKAYLDQVAAFGDLSESEKESYDASERLYLIGTGEQAYDSSRALLAQVESARQNISYTVQTGDNLWAISSKSDVYGNPYKWPLIFKANRGQINDPDLIFPGQAFTVEMNPANEAVDAAVKHARARGSWSVGTAEPEDSSYLGM